MASLLPLRRKLQRPANRNKLVREAGLGMASGLGATLYSFVRIAELLGEPAMLDAASQAASAISSELITGDRQLDVLGGVAGAILGLLALHRATGDSTHLNWATACGQHLLDQRRASSFGPPAWSTVVADRLFIGFSHGAAGIAFSLLRLFETTQNADFWNAAQEGIAFEKHAFSTSDDNWPVSIASTQANGELEFLAAWCYGAPAIGLARIGRPSHAGHSRGAAGHRRRLTVHAASQLFDGADHLCCELGRLELLLAAGLRLDRPRVDRPDSPSPGSRIVRRATASWTVSTYTGSRMASPHPEFFRELPASVISC